MTLALYFAVMLALTGFLVWRAAARWWHYPVIALLTVPLFPYVARHIAGDMSMYFPPGTFSDGAQGKDEIILVSAASTVIIAVMFAACLVWFANAVWRTIRARSRTAVGPRSSS